MDDHASCPECGIRYAAELDTCPWCGATRPTAPESALDEFYEDRPPPQPPRPTPGPGHRGPPVRPGGDRPGTPPDRSEAGRPDTDGRRPGPPTPPGAPAPPAPPPTPSGSAETVVAPAATIPPHDDEASLRRRRRRRAWIRNGLGIIGLLIIGILIAEFLPVGGGGGSAASTTFPDVTQIIDETTTTTTTSTTTTTTAPAETTVPSTTTTTTVPPTTTLPPIEPIGDPIAIGDLTMGVDVLGDFGFGSDGLEVAGRLAATFGAPTDDSGIVTSDGLLGTCAGDLVHVYWFGSLAVINVVEDGSEIFSAYRVDLDYADEPSPADDLATISGVSPGDSVGDLTSTYAGFTVDFVTEGDTTTFELRRPSDDALLLFGPVTSAGADGVVRGIYSPNACAG